MRKAWIVLLTALAFGCTTVRAPAGSLGERLDVAGGTVAAPLAEVWLESGKPITPEEQARTEAQVREALGAAVSGYAVAPGALGATDPLLVVRARGVARTESRRSDQRAATIGLVVGVIVVIAAVIVIAVLSRDAPKKAPSMSSSGSRAAPRGAPQRVQVAPAPTRTPVAVAPPPRVPLAPPPAPVRPPPPAPGPGGLPRYPRGQPPAPYPYPGPVYTADHGPDVWVGLDFGFYVPLGEPTPEPPAWVEGGPPAAYGSPPPYVPPPPPQTPPPPAAAQAAAPQPPSIELSLPGMPVVELESRGFFDGDVTLLELDLVDRADGRLLWSRGEREDVDPRDPRAVARLVSRLLAGQPWAVPATAPAGAPAAR